MAVTLPLSETFTSRSCFHFSNYFVSAIWSISR